MNKASTRLLCLSCLFLATGAASAKPTFLPRGGFVPDEKTAIRIAVAVWSPLYGEKQIQGEKPFRARLKKGVWMVLGSLPRGSAGGVATAFINKKDGRILNIFHTK